MGAARAFVRLLRLLLAGRSAARAQRLILLKNESKRRIDAAFLAGNPIFHLIPFDYFLAHSPIESRPRKAGGWSSAGLTIPFDDETLRIAVREWLWKFKK